MFFVERFQLGLLSQGLFKTLNFGELSDDVLIQLVDTVKCFLADCILVVC